MPRSKSQVSTYEIRAPLRAPIDFAYRWCTDYDVDDPKREKKHFLRRVLKRNRREVVFEDLYDLENGWTWSRYTVRLDPPRSWHADVVGNYRGWSLDYELRALRDGTTELRITGERRPMVLGQANPTRPAMEGELRDLWATLGRELEKDYRAARKRGRREGA